MVIPLSYHLAIIINHSLVNTLYHNLYVRNGGCMVPLLYCANAGSPLQQSVGGARVGLSTRTTSTEALIHRWELITDYLFEGLVEYIPGRMETVTEAKRTYTKYRIDQFHLFVPFRICSAKKIEKYNP